MHKHDSPRPLLTPRELAKALRVCTATVRRWTQEGRIPAISVAPRITRYNLQQVLDALASNGKGASHV